MSTAIITLCGRPTRRGTCHMRLSSAGKCAVHDSTDLAARNAKVAAAFRDRNPAAFTAQRKRAGRAGFVAAGGQAWWYEQADRASFGRNAQREAKRAWLEARGWNVHYFYYDADLQGETQRLAEFLQQHNLIV